MYALNAVASPVGPLVRPYRGCHGRDHTRDNVRHGITF